MQFYSIPMHCDSMDCLPGNAARLTNGESNLYLGKDRCPNDSCWGSGFLLDSLLTIWCTYTCSDYIGNSIFVLLKSLTPNGLILETPYLGFGWP